MSVANTVMKAMIIILKLRNIKRTDEYIEADYIPEGGEETGHIKIDLRTGDCLERVLTTLDRHFKIYARMACEGLMRLKDDETLPEEYTVMWY